MKKIYIPWLKNADGSSDDLFYENNHTKYFHDEASAKIYGNEMLNELEANADEDTKLDIEMGNIEIDILVFEGGD